MPSRPLSTTNRSGASSSSRARLACFEWARAFGCVAIVALHVYTMLWDVAGRSTFGPLRAFLEGSFVLVIGRWAVPVFLMISGALLLNPKRQVGWDRIGRYVQRMLFVLATFGLLFCLIESVVTHGGLSLTVVGEALLNLVTARSWGHLWYVYALLGLYLLTPLLRKLTGSGNRRLLEYVLLALYVLVLGTLTVLHVMDRTVDLPVNLLPALFYYLLGWYTWEYLQLDAVTVGAGVASLVAMLIGQALQHGELSLPQYALVAPYGVLVFLLFKRYATTPVAQVPVVALLATLSFGIYVVHPFFLHVLVRICNPAALPPGMYEVLAFVVALSCSIILVRGLRLIPAFRRYL